MSTNHPIKAWRDQHNKTQEDVASLLNVTEMTVSRWERGRGIPRQDSLRMIRRRLGIEPEQLIKHAMRTA